MRARTMRTAVMLNVPGYWIEQVDQHNIVKSHHWNLSRTTETLYRNGIVINGTTKFIPELKQKTYIVIIEILTEQHSHQCNLNRTTHIFITEA